MGDGEKGGIIGMVACGCCCSILFIGGFLGAQFVLLIFTRKCIHLGVTIDEAKVQENCEPGRTLENLSRSILYPGCGPIAGMTIEEIDECGQPCYSGKFLDEMAKFNKANPGKLVSFPSRIAAGTMNATLTGWWAPAPSSMKRRLAEKAHGEKPPVIVIQHGYTSNSNKYSEHVAAYLLRKIGFSVLINNFRDHCYSANTTQHIYQWGQSYPYDLLGAWDYVQSDPDAKLGGPTPKEKVGLMGFSKGAFTALNAFGLEPNVIGAWVDGPPLDLHSMVKYNGRLMLESKGVPTTIADFIANFYVTPLFANLQAAAGEYGVDLDQNTPLDSLAKGPPTQRRIQWVGNTRDTKVQYEWGEDLSHFLSHHREKYIVSSKIFTELCQDEDHCVDHLREPVVYSSLMCDFWTKAMKLPADYCSGKAEEIPETNAQ